jgi:membrane-associated phospholipid phosphatase
MASQIQTERTRLWVEALVIVWLCWVYDAITNLAPLRLDAALSHARGILNLEHTLHLDPELALNRWLVGHHTLGLALSDYYDNAHFIVTLGLLGWLWYRRADIYRPLRNSLVLINVLGFLVFWLYPVAPPRMLTGMGFDDVVAATQAFGSWHTGALASAANQLAAMPSLHMAWAAWCSVALWSLSRDMNPTHPTPRRLVRALAILYPSLTCLAVLATGNHFLVDVVAGLATAAVAVLLVQVVRAPRMKGIRMQSAISVAPVTNLLRSPRPGRLPKAAADGLRRD